MTEPTAALTFRQLLVEVALKAGVAHYGENGDEEPQVPINPHDLSECKRYVNNGFRMFLADSPATGWRWARPTVTLVLWPDVAVDATVTATSVYDPVTDTTLITASEASFYPSMELKTLTVTGVGDLTISTYVSTTQVRVASNETWAGSATFAISSDGDFTLPRTFGGQYIGPITYGAESNTGAHIQWCGETEIRRYREPSTSETGYPFRACVRRTATARRWELMVYPRPSELESVVFPYDLYFDTFTDFDEMHPAGYKFDEAVKAACFAVLERDVEEVIGSANDYYRNVALLNAHQTDARSAPQRLGYAGDGLSSMSQDDYRRFVERPTVTYDLTTP